MAIPAGVISGIALANALLPVAKQLFEAGQAIYALIESSKAQDDELKKHIAVTKPLVEAAIAEVNAYQFTPRSSV